MNREIIIGRSSDLDMVLVEDMVSRRHAKISSTDAEVYIQDIGSTNGTFVNGEKIAGRALPARGRSHPGRHVDHQGRRGRGRSSRDRPRPRRAAGSRPARSSARQTQGRPMSGVIEEIPLPDLLQLLSTSRKSGVLTVNNGVSLGKIYLRKGAIYFATINDDFAGRPQKAIYRMLTWLTGTFELEPQVEMQVMEEIQESTEGLLMEGVRQLDEFRNMQKQPAAARLAARGADAARRQAARPDAERARHVPARARSRPAAEGAR